MKRILVFLLLLGCLTACHKVPAATPTPSETVTPTVTPEPTEEVKTLWGFPIDETHDAFEVPTGGKLGTVLVTVEQGEQNTGTEFGGFHCTFCVWSDPLDSPIQMMEDEIERWVFGQHDVVDASFDGHTDFAYLIGRGIQAEIWSLWLWDEEAGQFVEEPEYSTISSPRINPETQVIDGWNRSSAAGDGVTTFHRWEDGKLVCVRRIKADCPWGEPTTLFVEDRVNGELVEVYYKEFPWDGEEIEGQEAWWQERCRWESLDYHGEEG